MPGQLYKCEGCGLIDTGHVGINLLNGHLTLCPACLTELNGKNPQLIVIRKLLEESNRVVNTLVDVLKMSKEVLAKVMVNCDSAFAGDSVRGPKPFVDLIHDLAQRQTQFITGILNSTSTGGDDD